MPATEQEKLKYQALIVDQVKALGCLDFDPEATLWHYTNGAGLIGILESGTIYATQVACLNDTTEVRYASRIYRDAVSQLNESKIGDLVAHKFLLKILEYTLEQPSLPSHGGSRFFVACFSSREDDLSQWRSYSPEGGENGYALGFKARGLYNPPFGALLRVNYNKDEHKRAATEIAEATLRFFLDGLKNDPSRTQDTWANEFLEEWDNWVNKLSPVVKDDCFRDEDEFRIVHELDFQEYHRIRFTQKATMLSRHLPLSFPTWMQTRYPIMPLVKVIVGPGRQQAITAVGVKVLLKQMGYGELPVTISQRPLQRP
jgi:hypothetical protein